MYRTLLVLVMLVSPASLALSQEPAPTVAAKDDKGQQEREAEFAKRLSGTTLQGFFSTTEETSGDEPPTLRGDRYDLVKAEKGKEGRWLFQSRIRYGDRDVTIPLNLVVEWAGETPVIVVDNLSIPGMGTFTARVMFHEDHYAGYWSGGDHGGHLFGRIVRDADGEEKKPSADRQVPRERQESPR